MRSLSAGTSESFFGNQERRLPLCHILHTLEIRYPAFVDDADRRGRRSVVLGNPVLRHRHASTEMPGVGKLDSLANRVRRYLDGPCMPWILRDGTSLDAWVAAPIKAFKSDNRARLEET